MLSAIGHLINNRKDWHILINKDYMMIMRAGLRSKMEPEKQEYAGIVLGICLMFALLVLLIFCVDARSATLDQWADAIRITEGVNSHYPYGIKSVKTHNPRQVCKNTVMHAWRDYRGNKTDLHAFVVFLADRYCPLSVDPIGNRNWIHNMESIML